MPTMASHTDGRELQFPVADLNMPTPINPHGQAPIHPLHDFAPLLLTLAIWIALAAVVLLLSR
jgi:hypothetical protein